MSGLFDQFKEWYEKRHDYARAWKSRTGGQVVATMCTYTPEEILIAAGMLPVRVLGAHEPQNVTEPHIFGMFCPFCRDSLAQGDGLGLGVGSHSNSDKRSLKIPVRPISFASALVATN